MDSTYQGPQSALYPIQSKDMTTPKDGWEWKSVKKYKGMSGVTLYEFTPPNRKKTKVTRHPHPSLRAVMSLDRIG